MTSSRLLEQITAARWFGGKGRTARLAGLTPLPWLRPPGDWPAIRSEIADIGYDDGSHEHYQLVIGYRPATEPPPDPAAASEPLITIDDPDHGRLAGHDATADPRLHAALLALIIDQDRRGDRTVLAGHRLGLPGGLRPGLPSRVFSGEQSNTSILYGDVALAKLFRRLEPGRNPDIAVHDQLTRAGTAGIARLYGWLQAGIPDTAEPFDLMMMVEQVADARDGWRLALEAIAQGRPFDAEAAALGAALASVHAGLRQHFPTGELRGDVIADAMISRLDAATAVVADLEPLRTRLAAIFDRLRGETVPVQRLHGDCHLGQALWSTDRWTIIDFEGEPAKPFTERTGPDNIWRDLAGVLRSFDYAAAQAAMSSAAAAPDRAWRDACQQAFLTGYGDAATAGAGPLRAAYLADKAIYEVVYEARNRPDWVVIPLTAAAQLADGAQS